MGREVRRVPIDWEHPKDANGHYKPLFEGFGKALSDWVKDAVMWARGFRMDCVSNEWLPLEDKHKGLTYAEYDGPQPAAEDYMPDFSADEALGYRMYEVTTEGTPISPAFATPEELARWLVNNNASTFGSNTATYEQWLRVCRGGYAPTMIVFHGKITSGVEGLSGMDSDRSAI